VNASSIGCRAWTSPPRARWDGSPTRHMNAGSRRRCYGPRVGGLRMTRRAVALLVTAVIVVSCGSNPASTPQDASASTVTSREPSASALVGTWERETHCEELVSVLTEAGLEQWILETVAGNGFVPGVASPDQIADPANPCEGAVPREHSHFFTEDGQFGSLDWNGEQVDDGTYEVMDENTFVISKEFPDVTFNYTVEGDTIAFAPVIPECSPDCFEAAWSVTVAYPGETWQRVD
jgi:hypothetical protein